MLYVVEKLCDAEVSSEEQSSQEAASASETAEQGEIRLSRRRTQARARHSPNIAGSYATSKSNGDARGEIRESLLVHFNLELFVSMISRATRE